MANKIFITSSFKLKGKTIQVVIDNDMCNDESYLGEADFTNKIITLSDRNIEHSKVPRVDQQKTFYHELIHMILDAANRHKLKYNEDLVDEMGLLLYEFERTKK
jgi:hypothetical protein